MRDNREPEKLVDPPVTRRPLALVLLAKPLQLLGLTLADSVGSQRVKPEGIIGRALGRHGFVLAHGGHVIYEVGKFPEVLIQEPRTLVLS